MPETSEPPQEFARRIQIFLVSCREPVFLEEGEEPIGLGGGNYLLEERNGRLMFQAWAAGRSVLRRVVGIKAERPGRLELEIRKFSGRAGRITLFDSARAQNRLMAIQGSRRSFREHFRRFLRRQFTGWTLVELTTEADLENSLSPQYSRAFLRQGQQGWAAIGAPEGGEAPGSVTFGLIWLDYLRRREQRVAVRGLVLLVPDGAAETISLRLRWLDAGAFEARLFVYAADGGEHEVDAADFGNLETHLEPLSRRRERRPHSAASRPISIKSRVNVDDVNRYRPSGVCPSCCSASSGPHSVDSGATVRPASWSMGTMEKSFTLCTAAGALRPTPWTTR